LTGLWGFVQEAELVQKAQEIGTPNCYGHAQKDGNHENGAIGGLPPGLVRVHWCFPMIVEHPFNDLTPLTVPEERRQIRAMNPTKAVGGDRRALGTVR
jgi:hypothetical protein